MHCPAGTFAGVKQKQCTPCPRGMYQNRARQGVCQRCPSATYTRDIGSKSISDCVPVCGFGTYSPTGLVPCLECPRNSYTSEPPAAGFKDCQACPAGSYTYQPAAPNADHCRGEHFISITQQIQINIFILFSWKNFKLKLSSFERLHELGM